MIRGLNPYWTLHIEIWGSERESVERFTNVFPYLPIYLYLRYLSRLSYVRTTASHSTYLVWSECHRPSPEGQRFATICNDLGDETFNQWWLEVGIHVRVM